MEVSLIRTNISYGPLQGNAKELYLLTDADFKKLGSVPKANPKHKDWTPMRLYLESQVRMHKPDSLGHPKVSALYDGTGMV